MRSALAKVQFFETHASRKVQFRDFALQGKFTCSLGKRAPSRAAIFEKRSRESAVLRNARLQEGAVLRIRASGKEFKCSLGKRAPSRAAIFEKRFCSFAKRALLSLENCSSRISIFPKMWRRRYAFHNGISDKTSRKHLLVTFLSGTVGNAGERGILQRPDTRTKKEARTE